MLMTFLGPASPGHRSWLTFTGEPVGRILESQYPDQRAAWRVQCGCSNLQISVQGSPVLKVCQGTNSCRLVLFPAPLLCGVGNDRRDGWCRLLVDEYQQSKDGSYHLTSMATDLFRMMRREGLRVSLVPDVMAATTGVYNGSRGAYPCVYVQAHA